MAAIAELDIHALDEAMLAQVKRAADVVRALLACVDRKAYLTQPQQDAIRAAEAWLAESESVP